MKHRFQRLAQALAMAVTGRAGPRRPDSCPQLPAGEHAFDFDQLAKDLAQGMSRRQALQRLGGGLVGAALAVLGVGTAFATTVDCGSYCKNYSPGQLAHRICTQSCENCQAAGGTVCALVAGGGGTVNCVYLATDINNCGACGNVCSRVIQNATPICVGGACSYSSCNSGFGDCDSNSANGCETPLNTSSHCGTCGNACVGSFPDCCPSPNSPGGYACTNEYKDPANCGSCGHTCSSANCCNGSCCEAGDTCCENVCCATGKKCAGASCMHSGDCCTGACDDGTFRCCLVQGQSGCSSTAPCCGGLTCSGGVCCHGTGLSCGEDSDCCSGMCTGSVGNKHCA